MSNSVISDGYRNALQQIHNLQGSDIFTAVDIACDVLGLPLPVPYEVSCSSCRWIGTNRETVFMPDKPEELRCPKCFKEVKK